MTDVFADVEEYKGKDSLEESGSKRLRTDEDPVLAEATQATKDSTRTLEQVLCELRHWETEVWKKWNSKIMNLPHWKHAIAHRLVMDLIDDAVDFSVCRRKLLSEETDEQLVYNCGDDCLEFSIKGHLHDHPLHLDVCTRCRIISRTDIKLLLMGLARRWDIKKLDFPGIYFTTTEGNTMRALRGDLMEECDCDLGQGAVIDFHFERR